MRNSDDMNAFITPETVTLYANTNEELLTCPPKGMIIEFPGLGGGSCLGGSADRGAYATWFAAHCGEQGILLTYLFPGPWSWGNKGAIRMADAVALALAKKYGLSPDGDFPLAVCGGSMGGLGALNYAANTELALCACAAACPCVDVMDRFNCHPDFPRTFLSAIASYDLPVEDALRSISPIEHLGDMPHIPYFICSDERDSLFPEAQCDAYVSQLRDLGHSVIYHRQPKMLHGYFLPEVSSGLRAFLVDAILHPHTNG